MSDPSPLYDVDLFGSRLMSEGRKAPPAHNGFGRGALSYVHGIIPDAVNREANDFYPTPPRSTRAMLAEEEFEGEIWEPACGDGAISEVLTAAGYSVRSSDLIDRGYGDVGVDFLRQSARVDNIVTNPPFKLAEEFVRHALKLSRRKVAFLCRLGWLEGKARRQLFLSTPIARVWVHSSRVPMLRGGEQMMANSGGMIAFAWYVWDHDHSGAPTLGWLA